MYLVPVSIGTLAVRRRKGKRFLICVQRIGMHSCISVRSVSIKCQTEISAMIAFLGNPPLLQANVCSASQYKSLLLFLHSLTWSSCMDIISSHSTLHVYNSCSKIASLNNLRIDN
jgi:hypothetical protein